MDNRLFKIAWRNLRRNLRRNLATGSAIAAGFTAFLLAAGYAYRVEKVLANYTIYALHVGHVGIYKKNSLEMFSIKPKDFAIGLDEQMQIERILSANSEIEMYGKYLQGKGLIGNGCKTFPFVATGVDTKIEDRLMNHPNLVKWNPHIIRSRNGKGIWDYPDELGAVSLSEGLTKLLGKTKTSSELGDVKPYIVEDCSSPSARDDFAKDANVQLAAGTWSGGLGALDGEVVSKFSTGLVETNNSSITTSIAHLQKLYDTDGVTNFSIWVKEPLLLKKTLVELDQQLKELNLEILPWTDERLSPYYVGTMHFIYVMVGFIGCVLALVVVLSIFNSATMTVIERSQEVGMLRSVGYNRSAIRKIFLLEGLMLTACSIAGGIILGLSAMMLINSLEIWINPPGVANGIQLLFAPNMVIVLIGAVSVSLLGMESTWLAVAGVVKQNIAHLVSGAHR